MYPTSASAVLPVLVTATPCCRYRNRRPRLPPARHLNGRVRPSDPGQRAALARTYMPTRNCRKEFTMRRQNGCLSTRGWRPEIRPLPTHARMSPGGTDPERNPAPPSCASHAQGRRAHAGQPTGAATPRLRFGPSHPPRARRLCGVVLRGHRPGADSSSAGPGAGPAKPVCRSCGRAQRLLPLVPRCQARARRAASIAALTTTVIPSASSRPSHGWSAKARPPSRPIRKA